MKNLNWFHRFLFLLNILFAIALAFAYLLPYIPPSSFALLSVFSLAVPLFIIINIIFLLYWLFRLKKQVLLSLIVLLLGFNHLTSIYEVSSTEEMVDEEGLKVLSYNVRQFNQFRWSDEEDMPERIAGFIHKKDPDIVVLQEYFRQELNVSRSYPHRYVNLKNSSAEFGLAIFSKYPIIDKGSLDFPTSTNNNAIYADILVNQDTVRVINTHLQSYSIKPSLDKIEREESKRVFLGMGQTFVRQEEQIDMVLKLAEDTPHKTIIVGDFNNTAYSYIYRKVRSKGFNDAYKEAGNGFGRTFDFRFFPLRIDFILPESSIEVLSFETFEDAEFSDHYPIKATLKL